MTSATVTAFDQLALHKDIFKVLDDVGYETPSPIQAQTIPLMLEGRDLVGQAQTGTGKTAAFALPILSKLDLKQKKPQVLVLAPTRELAIQVAEAFQKYAKHLKGFHVLPIYGGQDYRTQIRALERGVHVVVGTPGRVMDHMRKGNLSLDGLTTLVLDEADEMLRMGFIDDVEWVLEKTPPKRQIALFSATMPAQIRRIATQHLNNPEHVTIKLKTTTAETIRQRFWPVGGLHKLDALTRILEAETFDAMIVFVRTKTATVELAEKLEARGFASAALNGDIAQNQRERTVNNLKNGKLDILVATDVAARGLDVERVSHVINYDIPYDTEAYVHRIGRTGRAGREGDAILFVAPRERRMLQAIEKATNQKIEMMELPSTDLINNRRIEKFKQRITDTLAEKELGLFRDMIDKYQQEHDASLVDVAAALAKMLQGDAPFLLQNKPVGKPDKSWDREDKKSDRGSRADRGPREERRPRREQTDSRDQNQPLEAGMQRYRIEVGHEHNVKPGNIVGAIANEADIESKYIGRINIFDDHSLVDLPEGMPKELFHTLKKARVMGQALNISSFESGEPAGAEKEEGFDSPKKAFKEKDKDKGKGKDKTGKFAKTEKPTTIRVKKRLRDDKNKGKPKRAKKKDI